MFSIKFTSFNLLLSSTKLFFLLILIFALRNEGVRMSIRFWDFTILIISLLVTLIISLFNSSLINFSFLILIIFIISLPKILAFKYTV